MHHCFLVEEPLLPSNCATGDLQLLGGFTPNEGRVEVCINRVWGSLCHSQITTQMVNVICGELGYRTASRGWFVVVVVVTNNSHVHSLSLLSESYTRGGAYYGRGLLPVFYNFRCSGNESRLFNCRKIPFEVPCAYSDQYTGVKCEGVGVYSITLLRIAVPF